ncbi:ferritin [Candidatus Pacearchaeota archaeon]|nr:ferritin [Candidatus Pacearchaeota archaeon]
MGELYVCKICGEPYLGGDAPDDCPFCGAPKNFIKSADEFNELWKTELSELEKKNMEETLDLEINATAYYLDVSKNNEKYSKQNRLFKQLARVEKEHAEIAVKFLGIELPEIKGESSKGSIEEDLKKTKELEQGAIEKYNGFLKNATSVNVKIFYTALIHAEEGHQDVAESELE